MNVRIYLESSKKKERRIIFGVTIPTGRFWIKTSAYVDPRHFDVGKQKFTDKQVNTSVQAMKNFLVGLETLAIQERKALTRDYIKSKWDEVRGAKEKAPDKVKRSFLDYFDYLSEKLKNTQSYGTTKGFSQVKKHLLIFNEKIGFEDIDERLYDDYNEYLTSEAKNRTTGEIGLSVNTIGKHWDKIRKVCYEARKDGYLVNSVFENFGSPSERTKPIWLTKEEGVSLAQLDLKGYDEVIRDEFLARYYTSLRSSDMNAVKKELIQQIEGELFLKVRIAKTKKELMVPLHQNALAILEKHNYQFPDIPLQVKNKKIKEISQKAGINQSIHRVRYRGTKRVEMVNEKWELITTHTARRSFGRRFMESEGSIDQLREILGHSDTKTTSLYIGWEDKELSQMVKKIKFS